MNRKNLTAAVLAGLAGVAGIAGTAQAVNMNPDGLGQVLVYPYYTANNGQQTILSVVNTTDNAKAVKVRFLEGFNSREVLDFNLYLSEWDVWVAAIASADVCTDECATQLIIPDSSCTVPYLYDAAMGYGKQEFLTLAFSGTFWDGGPMSTGRTAEGHVEMIEMGTLTGTAADNVRHGDDDMPADCLALTDYWTDYVGDTSQEDGIWFTEANSNSDCNPYLDKGPIVDFTGCQAESYTEQNTGGLFGTAAVIDSENGTMFSYDAKAIDGFDSTLDGIHYLPGSTFPSLNSGNETDAYVFFGYPKSTVEELEYDVDPSDIGNGADASVDAVSAVFMHETIMNEYTIESELNAGTEWIVTFPTKSFYADPLQMIREFGSDYDWGYDGVARVPFTELYWAEEEMYEGVRECETVGLRTWDREENTQGDPDLPGGSRPPVVSPSLPGGCDPSLQVCDEPAVFQLCNEVNVLRFGDEVVFGTPEFEYSFEIGTGDDKETITRTDSLLVTLTEHDFEKGWGRMTFAGRDREGMVGLPVTGFAAYEFENGFVGCGDDVCTDTVKANYGGLFGHKASTRRLIVDDTPVR